MLAFTRDAEHRHDREVRQERIDGRLAAGVVDDLPVGIGHFVIGVLPLRDLLPSPLDHRHLGLDVRPGITVGTPEDLEPERDRGGAGKDHGGDGDAADPLATSPTHAAPVPVRWARRAPSAARMAEATVPKMNGPIASSAHCRYSARLDPTIVTSANTALNA